MSSIIFMGGGEFMGFGFSEGGVHESRSPIYIYVRAVGRLWGGSFSARSILLGRLEWLHLEKCFGAIEPLPKKKSDRMKVEIPAEHSGISGTYTLTSGRVWMPNNSHTQE